jgi:hypothetical protein
LKKHFSNFHLLIDSSSSADEVHIQFGTKQYLLDKCVLVDGIKDQLRNAIGYHHDFCDNGATSEKIVELLKMKTVAARLKSSVALTKTALVKRITYEDDGSASITELLFDTAIPIDHSSAPSTNTLVS